MTLPEQKYIYADTNVVSDICKPNGLLHKFMDKFSAANNLFCFSTYTLYEISKNDQLMERFQKFYSLFPCVVIASYFPLARMEFEFISGASKKINPVIFSPQGIRIDGEQLRPDTLKQLIEHPHFQGSFKNVDGYTSSFYDEMQSIFDSEEFQGVNIETCSRNQFIDRFKAYEIRFRFMSGQKSSVKFDKKVISKMKSLEVLAQGIYYKFYSDARRKVSKSDIIDVLIMTSAPYVDTFISEGNCVDIYRKIVRMNKSGIKNNYMTLAELRK